MAGVDQRHSADPGRRAGASDPPNAITGRFSVALAGDCVISRPISQLAHRLPGLAAVLDLLHNADVCCGNLETSIIDIGSFAGHPYCWDGDWPLLAEPSTAGDLAAMGFDMLARANNHALDWSLDGMRETTRRLDAAGLVHAGVGERLGLARRATCLETPEGRIGLVSVATTFRPTSEALAERDASPGRPGVSALRLRQIDIVTGDELSALRRFQSRTGDHADRVSAFGRTFEAGPERGYRHEMDPGDCADILRNIRQGRQVGDFLIVAVHSHETGRDGYPEPPSPFLKEFARAAIDAGADIVAVSGLHHAGPVDLYGGKPIIYGLGNFIWSDMQEVLPSELFDLNRNMLRDAFEQPDRATPADLNAVMNASYFTQPEVFETVLPVARFENARLVELVLHPIDLGKGDPLTTRGIPRLAEREQAERILNRIRDASAAYGCVHEIEIIDGKGCLRPAG
ncbi:MAG: CapA family protein [Rhizobiaceae bacterium]|nr:CapA family protein [Rhizobiaceae bacterium]